MSQGITKSSHWRFWNSLVSHFAKDVVNYKNLDIKLVIILVNFEDFFFPESLDIMNQSPSPVLFKITMIWGIFSHLR